MNVEMYSLSNLTGCQLALFFVLFQTPIPLPPTTHTHTHIITVITCMLFDKRSDMHIVYNQTLFTIACQNLRTTFLRLFYFKTDRFPFII